MRILLFLYFISTGSQVLAQAGLPSVSVGQLHRYEFKYRDSTTVKIIEVWTPSSYQPNYHYPVLYFQDGQMLFDSSTTWNKQEWKVDETISKMIDEGAMQPCIVVGIWNAGKSRHAEYFPQKPFESLSPIIQDSIYSAQRPEGNKVFSDHKIYSDDYLSFLVHTIKPFIDSAYSTRTDRANTFIAGSSMGGLISLYALCEYPDVFGGAACLSTHWPGVFTTENNPIPTAFLAYLEKNLPDPSTHKLYFDRGTETLDKLYEPYQYEADKIVTSKGFTTQQFTSLIFNGDDHSEKAWSGRLYVPLQFLLPPH